MNSKLCLVAVFVFAAFLAVGCQTAPKTDYDRASLSREVDAAVSEFKRVDPSMDKWFNASKGYAVFPTVGKGAAGIGGAYGKGQLFEGGQRTGYCDLSQATVGLQLGGQAYTEIIFFDSPLALENFKGNQFAFAAQASAVAASEGSAANADYENGVLVFTMAQGGLMFEASVGGQRFRYEPMP